MCIQGVQWLFESTSIYYISVIYTQMHHGKHNITSVMNCYVIFSTWIIPQGSVCLTVIVDPSVSTIVVGYTLAYVVRLAFVTEARLQFCLIVLISGLNKRHCKIPILYKMKGVIIVFFRMKYSLHRTISYTAKYEEGKNGKT